MSQRRRVLLIASAGLAGVVVLAWLIVGLVLDGYRIPSAAMSPSVEMGDRVLARSISGDEVSRGDVIIYVAPDRAGALPFERISRVVAVAGDEIGQEGNLLTINGELVDEPWLTADTSTPGIPSLEVPAGHVFVMGDNRSNSEDSRIFGPVPYDHVLKLVVVRWWPLGDFGGP